MGRPAWCLTQIIVISDLFSCEMGMSKIRTEMQLKKFCASCLMRCSTGGQYTYPQVTFLWHALEWIEV